METESHKLWIFEEVDFSAGLLCERVINVKTLQSDLADPKTIAQCPVGEYLEADECRSYYVHLEETIRNLGLHNSRKYAYTSNPTKVASVRQTMLNCILAEIEANMNEYREQLAILHERKKIIKEKIRTNKIAIKQEALVVRVMKCCTLESPKTSTDPLILIDYSGDGIITVKYRVPAERLIEAGILEKDQTFEIREYNINGSIIQKYVSGIETKNIDRTTIELSCAVQAKINELQVGEKCH